MLLRGASARLAGGGGAPKADVASGPLHRGRITIWKDQYPPAARLEPTLSLAPDGDGRATVSFNAATDLVSSIEIDHIITRGQPNGTIYHI